MRFRFGDFVFDIQRQELSRLGVEIPLEPKAFQVLSHLLIHRDRAVSKEELLEACWPGDYVTENALTRVLGVVRHAVDDDGARQHTIKTRRQYGYRFVAPVEEDPPASTSPQASAEPHSLDRLDTASAPVLSPASIAGSTCGHRYALLIGNGRYRFSQNYVQS